MPRRAAKIDTTHRAIADHLRAIGWSVFSSHAAGGGFPDLVASNSGFTALVECKTGKRGLNEMQKEFHENWRGFIAVASTPEEAASQLRCELRYWLKK